MTSDTTLPDPLTPPECDLRDFAWMPLDVRRLLTSETWILCNSDTKVAAVNLWCEAWHQVPAGSIPDNDRIISHLAQVKIGWSKIRDDVLRGWVKCADGRLYHPVVCEKARESWENKQAQRLRTEAARAARQKKRVDDPPMSSFPQSDVTFSVTENVTEPVTKSVTDNVTNSNRPDQTRSEREESPSSLRSEATPSSDDAVRRLDKRGSRLPADWQPGETGMSYALCHLRPDKIHDEIEKFRNYWHAKAGRDATKLDWNATWRNWVLTAKQHTPTPRETAKKPSPMAWMFEEAERRKRAESIPTIDTTGRTLQ